MTARWTLGRAGIVNVYQYGHETLHFAGGRLLLRGVNGSGKSTAMNMLLPFLLDGDTRRIDAAGEQAGVLKSWMLSGRDDPQPIGYLWVELSRPRTGSDRGEDGGHGEEHLVCGCGIKANRATDSVTTWWFVTTRRPEIDLALVEGRQPLSAEALRAVLGAEHVYRHDQRAAYREEVRRRLYGGADIDQHIRLLHVVRNPRVGDRVDVDLPAYLQDALPQLSDDALNDAAQPLDDLDEHRRNVRDLARTADTLGAIGAVYTSYARAELRRRADEAGALVKEVEGAHRAKRATDGEAAHARELLDEATSEIGRLEDDERRTRSELDALHESPAYREGRELNELRARVGDLEAAVVRAAGELSRRSEAVTAASREVGTASGSAEHDWAELEGVLADLASGAVAAGLGSSAPAVPTLETAPGEVVLPAGPLDPEPVLRGLEAARVAVGERRGDVREVRDLLAAVDDAAGQVARAEQARDAGRAEAQAKADARDTARRALDTAVLAWRRDLVAWTGRLDRHVRGDPTVPGGEGAGSGPEPAPGRPDLEGDLAARRDEVTAALERLAGSVVDAHMRRLARLEARRADQEEIVTECARVVDELDATVLPAPPTLAWQQEGGGMAFAELVDFAPSVPVGARAGLEAAMEAAGLLGAEVMADGTVVLAEGGLLVGPGPRVAEPLSALLTPTAGGERSGSPEPATVRRILDGISVDPADLEGPDGVTVVTPDGRFRMGLLRGRHAKPEAEHVGLAARRAALDRSRAGARARHDRALADLERIDGDLAAGRARVEEARGIRGDLPPVTPVAEAVIAAGMAEEDAARALERARELDEELVRAEEVHASLVDRSRRTAATLSLPVDPPELEHLVALLGDVERRADAAVGLTAALVRSVSAWEGAGRRWQQALEDEERARQDHRQALAARDVVGSRLATLEDTLGSDYDQIVASVTACEDELESTTGALAEARRRQLDRQGELEGARTRAAGAAERLAEASARAVAVLPRLRRATEVPGLLAAARGTAPGAALPPVDETPEGVGVLAAALRRLVPEPERADVTAESVRQSLRQRRDALGAGWDAEDRQVDDTLPLAVEVNGPHGRMPLAPALSLVTDRLEESAALLTSEQDEALRNLLQGLVAHEVSEKVHTATDLVGRINDRLGTVTTAHGIGVSVRWVRRRDLDPGLAGMVDLLAKPPELRTPDQDATLRAALSERLDEARLEDPEAPYRDLIGRMLDYRSWYEMTLVLHRPNRGPERLTRRTALSEGEKKIVSYLPLFAAVAASCDSLAESAPDAPRFVLLDDAFAKVSEDNHPKLFGLLVDLDLDFVATSERLWGTHATVPELAITEVLRDADLGVIVLEHSRWDGAARTELS